MPRAELRARRWVFEESPLKVEKRGFLGGVVLAVESFTASGVEDRPVSAWEGYRAEALVLLTVEGVGISRDAVLIRPHVQRMMSVHGSLLMAPDSNRLAIDEGN